MFAYFFIGFIFINLMKHENSAGAVVFYIKENEPVFLLLKYPTYWGFAKGWIEEGEDDEQAAKREVKEEAGLNVSFLPGFKEEQRWFYNSNQGEVKKHCVYFLAEISENDKNEIKISSEHQDFVFVTIKQSSGYVKIKQNKKLLEKAKKFIKNSKIGNISSIEKQKKLFR